MKKSPLHLLLAMLLFTITMLRAEVPQIIQFQSSISVGGSAYNGTGRFKFAFIDPHKAVTYWSNDGSSSSASEPAGL